MEIIRLLSQGEKDINVLLECLRGRAKKNKDLFKLALEGTLKDHHCSILKMILSDIEHNERNIFQLNETIDKIVATHYAEVVDRLDRVSGIASQTAQIIVSEIGDDMNRFPTADHLTAWCGVAPGNNESAGKRKHTSTKKGNKYLRLAMVAVAWAAVKTKESYWGILFKHLAKRMKPQKAIIVIARRLLKVVYRVIKENMLYTEKGVALFFELAQRNRYVAYTSR
jgi:transposase